jgi:hypothetical protein
MSGASPKPVAAPVASYAGAFAGIGEEARRAADLCNRLQESALHLLDNYTGPDRTRLMAELQHLDAVTQVLSSLEQFSSSAARQSRAGGKLDGDEAVLEIGLADVAYRLRLACYEEQGDDWRLEHGADETDIF